MKPHDAEQIIEAIGFGGHEWCPDDIRDTYEMEALETIAGMRAEYGVEVQRANGEWLPPYSWHDSPEQARTRVPALHVRGTANRRIVRRYVTPTEEA